MAFSADALTAISKLRRKIFDDSASPKHADERLWKFICDAVDEIKIRAGGEVEYSAEGFASPPSILQMEVYASVARILMGYWIGLEYRDGQAYIRDSPPRTQEEAIDEIVSIYAGEVIEVGDDPQ